MKTKLEKKSRTASWVVPFAHQIIGSAFKKLFHT
jgi:hypothetical protein